MKSILFKNKNKNLFNKYGHFKPFFDLLSGFDQSNISPK